MSDTTRTLTVTWDDPMLTANAGQGKSGLEFLQSMMRGEIPSPPIARLIGFQLSEVSEGKAVFTCVPGEQHYNPIGAVHGGLAATLLDSAMGCAVQSMLPEGVGYTTAELHINLVRAISATTGLIRAEAEVIHSGRRMATAQGRIVDAQGKLYAHGSTTCLVLGEK
jgi:uncharacterized protein (TIGR00369 family)